MLNLDLVIRMPGYYWLLKACFFGTSSTPPTSIAAFVRPLHQKFSSSQALGCSVHWYTSTFDLNMTATFKTAERSAGNASMADISSAPVQKVRENRCKKLRGHHSVSNLYKSKAAYLLSVTTTCPIWAQCNRIWCRRPVPIRIIKRLLVHEATEKWAMRFK